MSPPLVSIYYHIFGEIARPKFRRCTSKNEFFEKGRFLSPFQLGDGVRNLAGLVHLDFRLGDGFAQSLASGAGLSGSHIEGPGDGVTGHGLGLSLEELKDSFTASRSFLLFLRLGAPALLVALVHSGQQLGGLLGQLGGQVLSVDDSGVEFASSHFRFLFAHSAYGVGRHPNFFGVLSFPLASII